MMDPIVFSHRGMPIYLNPFIPLRMTKVIRSDEYESVEVEQDRLCIHFQGAIYVHPDRWDLFKSVVMGVR